MYKDWVCPYCQKFLVKVTHSDHYHCEACHYELLMVENIWCSDMSFVPTSFSVSSRNHLSELEVGHFWFKGRRLLLEKLISSLLIKKNNQKILEVGCGNGSFLEFLSRYSEDVIGMDGYFESLLMAKEKTAAVTLLQGDINYIPCKEKYFDFICAFDVLEHVAPLPFLQELNQKLAPEGQLLLSVPAYQSLWSTVDEEAGHRCRYSLEQLTEELEQCGFKVRGWTHYQFILFPLLWAIRKFSSGKGRSSLESKPSKLINILLGGINKFEVYMLSRKSLPFGSSLVVWAEPLVSVNKEKENNEFIK